MRPIPKKLRAKLSWDPYYSRCCLDGKTSQECSGRIQWHHNLIYAGRQVNREFCILPICAGHHDKANHKDIKALLNTEMIGRVRPEDRIEFGKVDFTRMNLISL